MAGVTIHTGPTDATVVASQVPRDQWGDLVRARRLFVQIKLPYDCRELLRFVEEAAPMLAPLGYADEADFIRRGLGLDPTLVHWAIDGLRALKPDEPIPFARAVQLGKNGRPTRNNSRITGVSVGKSDTRAYILARLTRDGHAELVRQVEAGDLSAHAAALQVGYRKQKTAVEQLAYWWQKATADEREQFLAWVTASRLRSA